MKRITQNSGRSSPRSSWHIIMSAPLCCQVQDARHLHFRLAHNQFYPAHAHLSVSCLKRLRVMVVCTRAFIERNRIKRHGLQSSVYFLFVWMQLMTGIDIGLVGPVARGASRFENLLAPQKTYWPPQKTNWSLPQNQTCATKNYFHKPTICT